MKRRCSWTFFLLVAFATAAAAETEPVEILRDPWGIPHVFADTDAGAFYGLGYATAEDRAFQMTYSLRMIQGRLAEVIGQVRQGNRNDTSLDHDRKMRTFGLYRAAQRTAERLDSETIRLLQAYCDGVNAYFDRHRDQLPPLFAQTGLAPEPWTPADCLASWWQRGRFFATDGTRDLIAGRTQATGQPRAGVARSGAPQRQATRDAAAPGGSEALEPLPPDDGPAVVKRGDVSADWIERTFRYAQERGLGNRHGSGQGPKFSHAWVVGRQRSTTGSAVLAAIPIRSRHDPTSGRAAQPGHRSDQDWQEILPYDLLPGVINPARRDIVRLGLLLCARAPRELSEDALAALVHLEPWYRGGASMTLTERGAALALELDTFFRIVSTDLAQIYGGGESGLAYFLKTATARWEQDPAAEVSSLERAFIDQTLAGAWRSAQQKYGSDPDTWTSQAREAVERQRLGYCESLHGFPTLDPALAIPLPSLERIDGGTIGCQTAQSYTQGVPMHDPDQALSILPIGQSERPDRPSRTSTLALWGEGKLHPAPLSKAAVQALGVTSTRLDRRSAEE
jgi:acyl-homoserine lactone acylase PvdQ